jgi:acetoacetate decarboxylase
VAYADVVYRRTPLRYSAPVRGRIDWTLHASSYDPIAELRPEVLSAHFMTSDVYGGGFAVEDRRLITRLLP